MADRLLTSKDADEVLSALRFETKLEKATLARMAFALFACQGRARSRKQPQFYRRGDEAPDFCW